MSESKFGKGKEHLEKEFLEELSHKIWSTKGSRFNASNRLYTISKYSNISNAFLSAYLTIFGLITVYNLYTDALIDPNVLAFLITAISIISLVFSLLESSEEYSLKAKEYHDCALDLADLYNELRNFKAYRKDASESEKMIFVDDLQKRYQSVLRRYPNHSNIDTRKFRMEYKEYYKIKDIFEPFKTNFVYYIKTKLLYHTLIFLPSLAIIFLVYLNNQNSISNGSSNTKHHNFKVSSGQSN
jgi:hypothetical protein